MAIIADWRASGLPRATYARQHGLSAAPPRIDASFIELALPSLLTAAPASIEVTLGGATVRVPTGADADTLGRIFAALRGAA